MNSSLSIDGKTILPGTQTEVYLKISEFYTHNPVYIPVIVSHGNTEGPKLFVTAAIHGDEINGIEIVRRLVSRIDPGTLNGTILFVPIVNIFGFYSMTRNMADRRDLDDCFPGIKKGSAASRIALILFEEIISLCDFGIDLHTPKANMLEILHVEADLSNREAHHLARAFSTSVIIDTPGKENSLQNAASGSGIPTVIYSGGEVLRFHEQVTDKGVLGILNVLSYLEMIEHEIRKPEYSIIVQKSRSVQTKSGGILHIDAQPGDLLYAGQEVAQVMDPFGSDVERIIAPESGLVISVSTNPFVNPGYGVYAYVMLDRSLGIVEEAIRKRNS